MDTSFEAGQPPLLATNKMRAGTQQGQPRRIDWQTGLWIALFLAPFLILYGGFTLWPLIATIFYSFYDWNGFDPLTHFIGLSNYLELVHDPLFWQSFGNTLIFAIVNTIIKLPLSLFGRLS